MQPTLPTPALTDLLTLAHADPQRPFVANLPHDGNRNGRVFGGQLLGQALAAALATVPPGRRPSCLQLVFLRGADVAQPIHYAVQSLQDGGRFSSRHVLATQQGKAVASAHVSAVAFAPAEGGGDEDLDLSAVPPPEQLHSVDDAPAPLRERLAPTTFRLTAKPTIEMRLVDPWHQLVPEEGQGHVPLECWMRAAQPLGDDPALHHAALAYLSDYYLTYPAAAPRMTRLPYRPAYVASLNHTMWFHRPCRADGWLYVRAQGQDLRDGRALARASVHTPDGRRVLTLAQECLLVDRQE